MAAALLALLGRALRPAPAIGAPPGSAPAPQPPRAGGRERRRRGSCEYHADGWGDRLVGYDGARREAWVVRLDRPVELRSRV